MNFSSASAPPTLRCQLCQAEHPVDEPIWACPCGGLLDVVTPARFPLDALESGPANLWRYREALPLQPGTLPVSLGESMTPLTPVHVNGVQVYLKIDHLLPTGSFKDRGAAILLTKMRELGVTSAVEDSSGNAGTAMAAYAAAAGVRMTVCAPASAPPAKLAQIRLYGARLVATPGTRQDAADAARAEARQSYYASHVWNPFFVEGVKTAAFEIWEQLARRIPDWIIAPLGNGTLVLGLQKGFAQLAAAGIVDRQPRIVAVQAANCAPLAAAWAAGQEALPATKTAATIADGIAIARPLRWRQILAAVKESQGEIRAIGEEAIWQAFTGWAARGIAVEPTAASALAAVDELAAGGRLRRSDLWVVVLTGSALKTAPAILDRT